MNIWKIELSKGAEKQLDGSPKDVSKRIAHYFEEMRVMKNPLIHCQIIHLAGELKGRYRLTIGNWRLFFTLDGKEKIIYVSAIQKREKDTYRRMQRR